MNGDKMILDKMPLDKMPLDKMPLDKMPLDKMPLDKMPLDKMTCCVLDRTATATIGALAENYDINDQGRSSGENTASTRSLCDIEFFNFHNMQVLKFKISKLSEPN
jgi:hypothetical protein